MKESHPIWLRAEASACFTRAGAAEILASPWRLDDEGLLINFPQPERQKKAKEANATPEIIPID
jgi:hypothetical protein